MYEIGCEFCHDAQQGYFLLDSIGHKNIAVMCTKCEIIWRSRK